MNEAECGGAASSSEEGGRKINLEIQGLEGLGHLRTIVNRKMRKVKDLIDKLRELIPELKEESTKIYQGKYLILQDDDMSILNFNEDNIVLQIAKKPVPKIESKESIEEIAEQKIKVEDGSMMMTEDDMMKKKEELRIFEEKMLSEEILIKKMKIVLEKQQVDQSLKEQILSKEKINVEYILAKAKQKENELKKTVESQKKILQDLEDKEIEKCLNYKAT